MPKTEAQRRASRKYEAKLRAQREQALADWEQQTADMGKLTEGQLRTRANYRARLGAIPKGRPIPLHIDQFLLPLRPPALMGLPDEDPGEYFRTTGDARAKLVYGWVPMLHTHEEALRTAFLASDPHDVPPTLLEYENALVVSRKGADDLLAFLETIRGEHTRLEVERNGQGEIVVTAKDARGTSRIGLLMSNGEVA